jgi:hypothetical protein
MKTYRIIYLPIGKQDKEWINIKANSIEEANNSFKLGIIININEIHGTDEE